METGVIFTAVITLLVGILVLFFGVSFINGKNLNLMAGYNSMSKTEKANTNIDKIGKTTGKTLVIISGLMFIFSVISFMCAFEIVSKSVFLISLIVFIISVVAVTIASVIKTMKLTMQLK